MKTKVKILYNEKNDDVFAFFPNELYNVHLYGKDIRTCYSHIGQHSSCHIDYANESIKATEEQSQPLIKELESLEYDLEILN